MWEDITKKCFKDICQRLESPYYPFLIGHSLTWVSSHRNKWPEWLLRDYVTLESINLINKWPRYIFSCPWNDIGTYETLRSKWTLMSEFLPFLIKCNYCLLVLVKKENEKPLLSKKRGRDVICAQLCSIANPIYLLFTGVDFTKGSNRQGASVVNTNERRSGASTMLCQY